MCGYRLNVLLSIVYYLQVYLVLTTLIMDSQLKYNFSLIHRSEIDKKISLVVKILIKIMRAGGDV